ncbi:hypothetical protein M3Y97_01102400 [Aphelenchoides bicaudatus]|nr:hypothetical protein M3Y97_01102400 [Aphelenchoides bicaudatus]
MKVLGVFAFISVLIHLSNAQTCPIPANSPFQCDQKTKSCGHPGFGCLKINGADWCCPKTLNDNNQDVYCYDSISVCKYYTFMCNVGSTNVYCARTCGKCIPGAEQVVKPAVTQGCVDTQEDCKNLVHMCQDETPKIRAFMRQYCPATCGCGTPTLGKCFDFNANCKTLLNLRETCTSPNLGNTKNDVLPMPSVLRNVWND